MISPLSASVFFGSSQNKENTPKNYSERFQSFVDNTDEKSVIISEMMQKLAQKKKAGWAEIDTDRPLDILDLGSAEGKLITSFCNTLQKKHPEQKLNVQAIEKDPYLLPKLRERKMPAGTTFNAIEGDCFQPSCERKSQDLILASHVFYHSKDPKKDLQTVYDRLRPKGTAFILMSSNKSDVGYLKGKYKPSKIGLSESQAGSQTLQSAKDIKKAIKTNKELKPGYEKSTIKAKLNFPGDFKEFKDWQLDRPKDKAPSSNATTIKNMLEFILDYDLDKLRQKGKLMGFLKDVENRFAENKKYNSSENNLSIKNKCFMLSGSELALPSKGNLQFIRKFINTIFR